MMRRLIQLFLALLTLPVLTSCFTGIEGTKKISLSKHDISETRPTSEELYLSNLTADTLRDWKPGKRFQVTDSRIAVLIEQPELHSIIAGDTLYFKATERKTTPDGSDALLIVFKKKDDEIKIGLEKDYDTALSNLTSTQLPMLIDLDMVDGITSLMEGKKFWTRTAAWYDEAGNYIGGRKFVPVTVNKIKPGNAQFPIEVIFSDESGVTASLPMNYGNSGNESRAFAKLFYLKDIRKEYPSISDENWKAIQSGRVMNGMTKEECRLSLGTPSDVNTGHDYSRALEIWYYPNGSYLQFADGLLINFRN